MIKRRDNIKTLAAIAVLAAGCMGGEFTTSEPQPGDGNPGVNPGTGASGGNAEALFQAAQGAFSGCGNSGCHGTPAGAGTTAFLGQPGGSDDYETLKQPGNVSRYLGNYNPATATILSYGQQNHKGQSYSQQQIQAITAWLEAEAAGGGGGTPPTGGGGTPPPGGGGTPPVGTIDPNNYSLGQFAQCMTLTNLTGTQMVDWANKGSGAGQCVRCHESGANRLPVSNNANASLAALQNNPSSFFRAKFDPVTQTQSVVPNAELLTRFGTTNNDGHPNYDINDEYYGYLQAFHQATLTSMQAGNCGPIAAPPAALLPEPVPPTVPGSREDNEPYYEPDFGGCSAGGGLSGLSSLLLALGGMAFFGRRRRKA